MRYLPLMLKLRGKSTKQSHRAPVYYVDLCLRDGMSLEEALTQAKAEAARQEEAGVNIDALESVARFALANGAFEESEEEIPSIIEELYPEPVAGHVEEGIGQNENNSLNPTTPASLSSKLSHRLGVRVEADTTS